MDLALTTEFTRSSVEEYCAALEQLGWESEMHQLDCNRGNSRLRGVAVGEAALLRLDFDNRLHQRVLPPRGYRVFGLLAGPQSRGIVAGRALEPDFLIHMDSHHGLDAVIEDGFSGYTLAISEQRLQQLVRICQVSLEPSGAPGSLLPLAPEVAANIRSVMAQTLRTILAGGSAEALQWELPALVVRSIQDTASRAEGGGSRARVLRAALEYLQAHPGEALTVEQLCLACACSISTLERAFRERFGVPPKRYLLCRRLSGARRALLHEGRERSVTAIANDWGFSHLGKFAADYRRQFGEKPSSTAGGRH